MGRSHSRYSSSSSSNEKHKTYHTKPHGRSHRKKVKKRSVNRNASNSRQKDKILNLTQKVCNMVDADKKRNRSEKHKNKLASCGCPYNCEDEILALRNSIENLRSGLSLCHKERPIFQLDHFIDDHYQLLSEAWISIGPSKLKDLVSANLLSICARREPILSGTVNLDPVELVRNPGNKSEIANSEKDNCSHSPKPNSVCKMTSEMQFHDADSTTALCSVLENQFDIQKATDHGIISDKLHTNSESFTKSWSCTSPKDVRTEEKHSTGETCHISDSKDLVDLVHQEITELEMRARAIRAMLKTKSDQLKL
ncbi:hypothetical protein Smp_122790 [Schistosoma mansoni]|uniref:hypothetical protein n=1 Tax=Schistosoma mansoni TaxID=6183 RepID=UPI0001A633BF|nr:hypothetical protein Smp_122790 [Schistosoma mansoni]|eukprot:XP_018650602.1 hypothetical protein Smp_122790 [Schistosoma mansoni]